MSACEHIWVTSTRERGPYCCDCNRPLVGIFTPVLRDTPAGALMWAMKQDQKPIPSQGHTMKTIFKYTLQQHGAAIVPMPKGATILHIGNQCDALQLWAMVDAEQPLEARRIRVAFTGEALEDSPRIYLGTWISNGGNLVAHVFEEAT